MDVVRSPWIAAFGLVVLVHLVLNGLDATPWDSITKCFLAPLLVAWVLQHRGPRLLAAALVLCFLGDLLLELEGMFVAGMAAFAAAHVCFIVLLVQRGGLPAVRARPWIPAVYALAGVALVAWAWGGLEVGLRVPVPVYALLLLGTASLSLALDLRAGVGGLLFLVSDGVIALAEAGRLDPEATPTGLVIMALYSMAILLLAVGVLARERATLDVPAGSDPAQRTDCWPVRPPVR